MRRFSRAAPLLTWRRRVRPGAQVLEKARAAKFLGASLEAKVLLHVGDAALRELLVRHDSQPNGADPLRYGLIVSQVRQQTDRDCRRRRQGPGALGCAPCAISLAQPCVCRAIERCEGAGVTRGGMLVLIGMGASGGGAAGPRPSIIDIRILCMAAK
jgi:hypothetical protein